MFLNAVLFGAIVAPSRVPAPCTFTGSVRKQLLQLWCSGQRSPTYRANKSHGRYEVAVVFISTTKIQCVLMTKVISVTRGFH